MPTYDVTWRCQRPGGEDVLRHERCEAADVTDAALRYYDGDFTVETVSPSYAWAGLELIGSWPSDPQMGPPPQEQFRTWIEASPVDQDEQET